MALRIAETASAVQSVGAQSGTPLSCQWVTRSNTSICAMAGRTVHTATLASITTPKEEFEVPSILFLSRLVDRLDDIKIKRLSTALGQDLLAVLANALHCVHPTGNRRLPLFLLLFQ